MNTHLLTAFKLAKNKLVAIFVLVVLMVAYAFIPPVHFDPDTGLKTGGMEYSELLFTAILALGVVVLTPLLRLLFFPEVADFAEGDGLNNELNAGKFSPKLVHYWITTVICFLITVAVLSTLHH